MYFAYAGEDESVAENHIPCITEGIINKYKNREFIEYVIVHDQNQYKISEDGDKLYVDDTSGNLGAPIKKEIVYVVKY